MPTRTDDDGVTHASVEPSPRLRSLRAKIGIVHQLEDAGDRHEWTVCRRFMTRSGDLDHFPGRRSNDAVTCVFCLAGIRWKDFSR